MKRIVATLLILACGTAVAAVPGPAPQPAPASPPIDTQPSPLQQLRIGVESLMAFMNQDPLPAPSAIARYLDQEIAPMFDFDAMAGAAGRRYYQTLSPRQKAAMADEIKQMFLTRLTLGLVAYEGQQVRFLRPRISPDGSEAMISMMILNPGRYPARIDFRLAVRGNDWRIIDLAANGTSAVVYYRQMLATEMMRRAYARGPVYPPMPPRY